MPPKKRTPPPIDRPLSRAYLRGFTGWCTAYPPGQTEPTSLRVMENMYVDRNGALVVRPGLRYLSYKTAPDIDPMLTQVPGTAIDREIVGATEPFFVRNGAKALLCAVRETDQSVGFRAILFQGASTIVYTLTDPAIGFAIPQGEAALNFTKATTHVEYLQIDNKIIAMSDAGEPIRMFFVGSEKVARKISTIAQPQWEDADKLQVVHPDAGWILKLPYTTRRNTCRNPSFEAGTEFWAVSANASMRTVPGGVSGGNMLEIKSLPQRTNIQISPLHDVPSTGVAGWHPHPDWGNPKVTADGTWMKIYESKEKGTFLAYGAKLYGNVAAGRRYRVALDYEIGTHVQPITVLTFYNSSGAKIGNSVSLVMPKKNGRFSSEAVTAPANTVTMRISIGGRNEAASSTFVRAKNVVLCADGESTAMFKPGDANFYWTSTPNASASVIHAASAVTLNSDHSTIAAGGALNGSLSYWTSAARTYGLLMRTFDKDRQPIEPPYQASGTSPVTTWTRIDVGTATTPANGVTAAVYLTVNAVARADTIYVDAALIEPTVSAVGTYFDGSTAPTTLTTNQWGDAATPHRTISVQTVQTNLSTIPTAETPTANTLIATGGPTANTYKMAFFYSFENEVGESMQSKVTEVRIKRPWSNWLWVEPKSADGDPDLTKPTQVADLCCDQLTVIIPKPVFDKAVAEGAVKWNLYAMAWSDQEPVPVVAPLVGERDLYSDQSHSGVPQHADLGWQSITPARKISINDSVLPTRTNRINFSKAPQIRNGLVAGDRLIVVGDPDEMATIKWTSNRAGNYTNFTASRGGGAKTLTSGNLNIPNAVVLWQNPQSVDTLTILCSAADGQSVSYYMTPANITGQSGNIAVMGFEETTSTPGTHAPYAAEVLNNALYRPLDRALLKSTAQNYNISHKSQTDKIFNMWWRLQSKNKMMSAQLDNRLYYLVHNPAGEILKEGCRGNEIWVYDIAGENGVWNRYLVQGSALRAFSLGDREYMGITCPGGLFYFDLEANLDDFVDTDGKVRQRPIPWRFETNTQGANKAHDAWAHLQQVQITLGNFQGTMRYGIKGHDVHHKDIVAEKQFSDLHTLGAEGDTWDVDDILQVRRDLKEWVLFGSSVDGLQSSGQLGYVQYRYTPVSVNIGYELGSVETFEYGANVASGPTIYSDNGIPVPVIDFSRP